MLARIAMSWSTIPWRQWSFFMRSQIHDLKLCALAAWIFFDGLLLLVLGQLGLLLLEWLAGCRVGTAARAPPRLLPAHPRPLQPAMVPYVEKNLFVVKTIEMDLLVVQPRLAPETMLQERVLELLFIDLKAKVLRLMEMFFSLGLKIIVLTLEHLLAMLVVVKPLERLLAKLVALLAGLLHGLNWRLPL